MYPTQFGPNKDLDRYPRDLDHDLALLRAKGVAAVFAPSHEEMYLPSADAIVDVPSLSDILRRSAMILLAVAFGDVLLIDQRLIDPGKDSS